VSRPPREPDRLPLAILMSGTGSNARRLLEQPDPRYEVRLLLTDNPASNAACIAAEFGVEYAELDIYRFCGAPHPGELEEPDSTRTGPVGSGPEVGTAGAGIGAAAGRVPVAGAAAGVGMGAGVGAAVGATVGAGADRAAEARRRLRKGEYAMLRKGEYAMLRNPQRRAAFDRELAGALQLCGARLTALAGYDWVLGSELCRAFLFVNVHPGDLRVRDCSGRRLYAGLGWVPTAKALLNGDRVVRCTTHLVKAALDGGPIARVSRAVPVELPAGLNPQNLLPPGVSLGEIAQDLRSGGRRFGREPIVRICQQAQERLKVEGDWVEFPRTVQSLAGLLLEGRLVQASDGSALLDGEPVGDMFLQPEGVS
jgi:folate-dependent phosphoribosylglycinamide formyltransferase PurN